MVLLAALASAAEPGDAFECPVLTEPADGLRYADPGEISGALYDVLSAWILAQYEEGCPVSCAHADDCTYTDDCYTSAGTHIVVEYARDPWYDDYEEAWSVAVETGEGTTVTLVSTTEYGYSWEPAYEDETQARPNMTTTAGTKIATGPTAARRSQRAPMIRRNPPSRPDPRTRAGAPEDAPGCCPLRASCPGGGGAGGADPRTEARRDRTERRPPIRPLSGPAAEIRPPAAQAPASPPPHGGNPTPCRSGPSFSAATRRKSDPLPLRPPFFRRRARWTARSRA